MLKTFHVTKNPNHPQPSIIYLCILCCLLLLPGSHVSGQTGNPKNLNGIWLGELVVPGQVALRMAVVVTSNGDNTYSSALNIIDQATGNIPIEKTQLSEDSIKFILTNLGIKIEGSVHERQINAVFRQAGAMFPLVLARVDKLPELLRPQEPKDPLPYKTEEVIFMNKQAGIRLAGTLTLPSGKGKCPAVVLITGSGKQNRDEEIAKHKPFLIIADYLTRQGIAVLRYDDRGAGGSAGDFDKATTGDFAKDALAAIEYLQSRKEVNATKIGIIGHSEGGMAASIAASMSDQVAFIISLAGMSRNFGETALEQMLNQSRAEGKSQEDIELERSWRKKLYTIAGEKSDSVAAAKKLWEVHQALTENEIKRLNWPKGRHDAQIRQLLNPWWRYSLSLDNRQILMQLKCPILALYGEKDVQVNASENMPFVEEALKRGGNRHVEIKMLSGLNHLFQTANTGLEYEYIRIDETMSPQVLQMMVDWIARLK